MSVKYTEVNEVHPVVQYLEVWTENTLCDTTRCLMGSARMRHQTEKPFGNQLLK